MGQNPKATMRGHWYDDDPDERVVVCACGAVARPASDQCGRCEDAAELRTALAGIARAGAGRPMGSGKVGW